MRHHFGPGTGRRLAAAALATSLLFAACGDDDGTSSTEATGGWIDGEPPWSPSGVDGASDTERTVDASAAAEAGSVEPPGGETSGPLRAGSVDDNADFPAFLDYLERLSSLGVVTRNYDPTGRVVVTVTDGDGGSVAGAEVRVSTAGAEVARLRTTADGTARFHPFLHGAGDAASFDITVGDVSVPAAPGESVEVTADARPDVDSAPLDVLFLLDATGSMGDEIAQLKTNIDAIATQVAALDSNPDVRFAMTVYRDTEDEFVTASYDFTSDVAEFHAALENVTANGGGDYPEALDEGLADALGGPAWRDPSDTTQLIFLVADAPPQVTREVEIPYTDALVDAVSRGIKIFPIASSGTDDQAEAVFRQLAQSTGARFVFLSYGAGGAATGGETDIDSTDYEELSLDALVVRLISEELAALTGEEVTAPSTTTTTTNPPGQ